MAKKTRKTAKVSEPQPEPIEPASDAGPETETPTPVPATGFEDPIGDVSDGEAGRSLADESRAEDESKAETEVETAAGSEAVSANAEEAAGDSVEPANHEPDSEPEFTPQPRPPAKLERLQKILSQAGVASRRKAEEMIEQGRVQVNGKVITELGTKADASRDHIRVDGKLLHGAERLRYFVLNKPKGFVTTVKDPEGRPTVMQFFEKMRERLYPVGRLDYMSEGLLLVTNDGDLANRLTKAGSGVEKVYLVKVAGQPTEQELDILRGGVAIERGKPGSPQVRTSPARIRQVRQGDNPWYEVVLIEGRNRELRKMFSAVGHFVEKIRRVGYGPLVLDQEPGNLRELEPEELAALRLAAEGKLRTPKAKEVRRRNLADAQLPTVPPKPSRPQQAKPFEPRRPAKLFAARNFDKGPAAAGRPGEFRPKRPFGAGQPFRPARPPAEGFRPDAGRAYGSKPAAGRTYGGKPAGRAFEGKPGSGKPAWKKPASTKPAWTKPGSSERPPFRRPAAPRREPSAPAGGFAQNRSPRLRIDAVEADRPDTRRPDTRRAGPARSSAGQPHFDRPGPGKPGFRKPGFGRPGSERSGGHGRSSPEPSGHSRPPRGESGLARPFTTSSGKPRAGGARPASKPFKPGGHSGSRPAADSGSRPAGKTGWKPKPGGFSRSGPKGGGYKGKPGGKKRK